MQPHFKSFPIRTTKTRLEIEIKRCLRTKHAIHFQNLKIGDCLLHHGNRARVVGVDRDFCSLYYVDEGKLQQITDADDIYRKLENAYF